MKEAIRSINETFSTPGLVALPLAAELQVPLDAFVERYRHISDHDSQRLQEDLLATYRAHVSASPSHNAQKLAPFINLLRQIRSLLVAESQVQEWARLVVWPVLDGGGEWSRATVDEAAALFLDFILLHPDRRESAVRVQRLSRTLLDHAFRQYLHHAQAPALKPSGLASGAGQAASQWQSVLLDFGRKRLKDFVTAVSARLTDKGTRVRSLKLLVAFLEDQIPHLYLVEDTELFDCLLKCLSLDTSGSAINLASTVLIMLMPHLPGSVAKHLPMLFIVYSRLLCWDTFDVAAPHRSDEQDAQAVKQGDNLLVMEKYPNPVSDDTWDAMLGPDEYKADGSTATTKTLFTLLYGLYPLNFTAFIRKPRRYLKAVDFPGVEAVDVDKLAIRTRSEPIGQMHLLHPNFLRTTLEDELKDSSWRLVEAHEILTDCARLSVAAKGVQDSRSGDVKEAGPSVDQPLPPIHFVFKLQADAEDGKPVGRLDQYNPVALEQEVAILRGHLGYERYVKLQYLSYINQLRNQQIRQLREETEAQTLVNANKNLKAKLAKSEDMYAKLKKETATSRSQSKKWDAELTSKIRQLREEQRTWQNDIDVSRLKYENLQLTADTLQIRLMENAGKEQRLAEKLQYLEQASEQGVEAQLREEVKLLKEQLAERNSVGLLLGAKETEVQILQASLQAARIKIESQNLELTQAKDALKATSAGSKWEELPHEKVVSAPVVESLKQAVVSAADKATKMQAAYEKLLERKRIIEERLLASEAREDAAKGQAAVSAALRQRKADASLEELPTRGLSPLNIAGEGDKASANPLRKGKEPQLQHASRSSPLQVPTADATPDQDIAALQRGREGSLDEDTTALPQVAAWSDKTSESSNAGISGSLASLSESAVAERCLALTIFCAQWQPRLVAEKAKKRRRKRAKRPSPECYVDFGTLCKRIRKIRKQLVMG